jgi:L-fuculose-phosphate aldolase
MATIPEQIVEFGRLMFERKLLDMAGGNISAREGDKLYISPAYSGSRQHWQLSPQDIICGDINNDEVLKDPRFSREGKAHLAIYRNFPDVNGVIHAHSFHILPFSAVEKEIKPVLEATEKFGVVPVVKAARAHTQDLADHIIEGLRGKEENIRKQAAAVLMPQHGIIVAGKDLLSAVDALERIDWNCWCILAGKLID